MQRPYAASVNLKLRMKRPKPINEESPFAPHELFFSKTDRRGVILTGNSIFRRVSGYSLEDLIGKPHSLIRHPDMPRCVFKLLWDTIQAGQPIVAYVKNLNAQGRYYWVLASVCPIEGGYVSIRLKPTTAILGVVKDLYAKVLAIEDKEGMDYAYGLLPGEIQALGFTDYVHFSQEALSQELESRAKLMQGTPHDHRAVEEAQDAYVAPPNQQKIHQILRRTTQQSHAALEQYGKIMSRLKILSEIRTRLSKESAEIRDSYLDVKFLPLNMAVESEKAGSEGATLAVVSETFRKWSEELRSSLEGFFKAAELIASKLSTSGFNVATSRLQIEMVSFFADEIHHQLESGDLQDDAVRDQAQEELQGFIELTRAAMSAVDRDLESLLKTSANLKQDGQKLKDAISALYIIRQSGRVEVSRLHGDKNGFNAHLDNMATFLRQVETRLKSIETDTSQMVTEVETIRHAITSILSAFHEVK